MVHINYYCVSSSASLQFFNSHSWIIKYESVFAIKTQKKQLGLTQTYSTIYHVVSPSLLVNRRISPCSQVDVPTRRGVGQTSRPNTCPSAAPSQAEMLAWQQQGEGTRAWMKCFWKCWWITITVIIYNPPTLKKILQIIPWPPRRTYERRVLLFNYPFPRSNPYLQKPIW